MHASTVPAEWPPPAKHARRKKMGTASASSRRYDSAAIFTIYTLNASIAYQNATLAQVPSLSLTT